METKICRKCNKEKEIIKFQKGQRTKNGVKEYYRYNICSKCQNRKKIYYYVKKSEVGNNFFDVSKMKNWLLNNE